MPMYHSEPNRAEPNRIYIYRVTYPLFSTDTFRDFGTKKEAEAFAQERRENIGNYQTVHAWQLVKIEKILICST